MQRLNDPMQKCSEHERSSRSGKLKLLKRIPLQKLVIAESGKAVVANESMLVAEKLQSSQTHRVIHGPRALLCGLIRLLFWLQWVLRQIE